MPEQQQTRDYHCVVTMQWQDTRGVLNVSTADCVYRARPGQTAQQIYRSVLDHLRAQSNIPASPSVMHWSMTPNQL